MADAVSATGLTPVPLGDHPLLRGVVEFNSDLEKLNSLTDALVVDGDDDEDWASTWEQLVGTLMVYRPALDDLVGFCRHWQPELVIWDPLCVPASLAARSCGAAHARLLWGQDNVAWLWAKARERLGGDGAQLAEPLSWLMEPMLKEHGLRFDAEMLHGQWTIDPLPPGLRLPVDEKYVPMRWVPYNGATALPAWLRESPGRPRVCLTLGLGGRGRQLFRESGVELRQLVDKLAQLDIELVATVDAAQRAALGTLPPHVRAVSYVPLDQLLPTCSAVIHHGGDGTIAASTVHEVPQLIVPMAFWGEANAARHVAARGAGLVVPVSELTADVVQRQTTRLLEDPSFRTGAAALHAEVRQAPTPRDTVPVLERLTEQYRQ
nr:nucleotide disphospho-sugar-binding domain-containing protein [Streptomyces sp. ST2-7A]